MSRAERASDRTSRAARVISLIDLTDLDARHEPDGIDTLVDRAIEWGTPAVCVWPEFVERVTGRRDPDHVDRLRIATVVNFPSGDAQVDSVIAETQDALARGADEIDLVLPYRALVAGDRELPTSMVTAIAELVAGFDGTRQPDTRRPGGSQSDSPQSATRRPGARHLKVILETGELFDRELIREAARLAIGAGADFIKSSTGTTSTSATLEAIEAMVDVIEETGGTTGLKPSGGIRTVDDAMRYLDLVDARLGADWATPETFRFGASSLLDDAVEALGR